MTTQQAPTQPVQTIANSNTPEGCLRQADELYKEGYWQEALGALHHGFSLRKTRSNMPLLERLMTQMVDICSEKLTTLHLKEDIGTFRNLCQHQSMNLLEKVLTYLRNKSERVFLDLEREYTHEKLVSLLSDEVAETPVEAPDQISSSDELIFLAYTSLDKLQEKHSV